MIFLSHINLFHPWLFYHHFTFSFPGVTIWMAYHGPNHFSFGELQLIHTWTESMLWVFWALYFFFFHFLIFNENRGYLTSCKHAVKSPLFFVKMYALVFFLLFLLKIYTQLSLRFCLNKHPLNALLGKPAFIWMVATGQIRLLVEQTVLRMFC